MNSYIIIGANRVKIPDCAGLLFNINEEAVLLLFNNEEERNEFYKTFNNQYTDILELEKIKEYYNNKYNTTECYSFSKKIINNIKYYMGLHF